MLGSAVAECDLSLVMAGARGGHSPEGTPALGSPSGPAKKGGRAMVTDTERFVALLLVMIGAMILLIEKLGPGILH